jgi:hypothetical protein
MHIGLIGGVGPAATDYYVASASAMIMGSLPALPKNGFTRFSHNRRVNAASGSAARQNNH